jgi:hypothetical protein
MNKEENIKEFKNKCLSLQKYIEAGLKTEEDTIVKSCSLSYCLTVLICESDQPHLEFAKIVESIAVTMHHALGLSKN